MGTTSASARVLSAAVITAAILGVGALVGSGGWPGEPSGCIANHDCYCERFTGGLVEQPVNTVSNLGFVLVGLWIIRRGIDRKHGSRIAREGSHTYLYGSVAIFLGIGSMLFHGSMTEWGGWVDLVSMHAFITFLVLYNIAVALTRSTAWFISAYAIANVGFGLVLWLMDNGYGKFLFGALVAVALATEYWIARGRAHASRNRAWLWAGLVTYGAGNVVWLLSRDGAPWCNPDSLLQGHALWHLTSAAAVFLLWKYLRTETAVSGTVDRTRMFTR